MNTKVENSRRQFLRGIGLGMGGVALAACVRSSPPPSTVTPLPPATPTPDNEPLKQAQKAAKDAQMAHETAEARVAELQFKLDQLTQTPPPTATVMPATPTPTATETPTETTAPDNTATATQTQVATVAVAPVPDSEQFKQLPAVQERAARLAKDFNLPVEEVMRRMAAVRDALFGAGITYGILDMDAIESATNPIYPQGVIADQKTNTYTVNKSEAGTVYVSFGGGTITDRDHEGKLFLQLSLPNGVVDLGKYPTLVNERKENYPYASQVYQVICANRPGPDVLPPEVPDQDLNTRLVVRPNAELQYATVQRGAWQAGGVQVKRTVSVDWLAEQILWGTGGGSNCGTGCGEVTLILVQTRTDSMTGDDHNYLTLAHVAALYEGGKTGGTTTYAAKKVMTVDYNDAGIAKINKYLAETVKPTWPATPTTTPTPTPKS